jgi:PAS domain S-box-containing protein
MAQMYGFASAAEIVGLRLGHFLDRSNSSNIEYLHNFIRSGYRLNDAESHEFDKHSNLKYFLNNLVGIVENGVLVQAWGSQRDITARKQAEAALKNNQKRLELAQKAGKIGTFEWNIQTNQVTWTAELEALYGFAPGGFGGKYDNWAESLHPDDRARAEQEVRSAASEGTELDSEFRILWSDGSIHWIAAKAQVFYDDTGKPLRMIGVNMDITQRQQVEEALRETEKQFRWLVESNIFGVVFGDLNGGIYYANDYLLKLLGYEQEDLLSGKVRWDKMTPAKFSHLDARAVEELRTHGICTPYEKEYIRKDGTPVPILVGAALLHEPDDQQHEVAAFILNLTERRRIEADLRLSEDRFRMLLENVKDYAIFLLDTQDRVVRWGAGAESILGYQEADILGQPGSIIFTPEDLQRGEDKKELNTAVTEGQAEDERWHVRKDGSRFWASGIMTSLRDQTGQLQGFAKILRDFTDRKQAEEEREQLLAREQEARTEAEAANRMKDEFLATLSHELRTPLNAMLGWTNLLRTRKFDEAATARALETIDRNTKSLAQLIEDILEVSRIITGKLRLDVRPVELVPVISAAIETVRTAADARQIEIESGLDSSVGLILGDANRLQQVVWNLLSNAVKFTPKGGRIEVRLECINSRAQIRVADTGQGISPEFLPYVFERFRQADSSSTRSHGGLGLGLAIVRHLVELHGGTVRAESLGLEQGATFIVELPLIAVRVVNEEPEQVKPTAGGELPPICLPSLDGLRVLVVDDEADARDLLTTVLEEYGAEVTSVATAGAALEALQQNDGGLEKSDRVHKSVASQQPENPKSAFSGGQSGSQNLKFDVLVSDIGMPGEDGYSLIRKVRALSSEQGGQIPAVALTAYARAQDRAQALLAGFQLHIPKPVDPSELAVVVSNLAGRNQGDLFSHPNL